MFEYELLKRIEMINNTINSKQRVVVIKCGGSIINDSSELNILANSIANLKKDGFQLVVVHGGGPEITGLCKRLNIQSSFVNGYRVTSKEVLDATQMALLGITNSQLVYQLNRANVTSIGLSGHDANLINADFMNEEELGFVGEITHINTTLLLNLLNMGITPVIAPLGVDSGPNGNTYNINADLVAAEVAAALKAYQLVLLSDIDGFYSDINNPDSIIKLLTVNEVTTMLQTDKISGGMIPKLTACNVALAGGASSTHIINGKQPQQLTAIVNNPNAGIGTTIINREPQ